VQRFRIMLGFIAGAFLILNAAAHSFLGWGQFSAALAAVHAPSEIIGGLALGWHLAGASMFVFGVIAIMLFARRIKNSQTLLWPATVIGIFFVIYGVVAFVFSGRDPFYFVFVAPGIFLIVAAAGQTSATR
jgi:hypothetical protein